VFTSKFVEEDYHGNLHGKEAYNELILNTGVSSYEDKVEEHEIYQYSQYIALKDTPWSNLKKVQRNNDLRNENLFTQAIAHYKQESMSLTNKKGVVVLPLHNQGLGMPSNGEEFKEREDINGNQDFS